MQLVYYVCTLSSGDVHFIGDFLSCLKYTRNTLRPGMRFSIVTEDYYNNYYK